MRDRSVISIGLGIIWKVRLYVFGLSGTHLYQIARMALGSNDVNWWRLLYSTVFCRIPSYMFRKMYLHVHPWLVCCPPQFKLSAHLITSLYSATTNHLERLGREDESGPTSAVISWAAQNDCVVFSLRHQSSHEAFNVVNLTTMEPDALFGSIQEPLCQMPISQVDQLPFINLLETRFYR